MISEEAPDSGGTRFRVGARPGTGDTDGARYAYTRPAPGHDPFHWYCSTPPLFDAVWGPEAHGVPGCAVLVHRNRRRRYNLLRIVDDGGPVVWEVMTNVLHALSVLAPGRPSLAPTIVHRMHDETTGLFRPLVRPEPRPTPTVTWASLSPLALPPLPDSSARCDSHPLR